MYSFTICLLILVVGYFVYGRYVERVFGPEAKRPTPALTKADGVDYIPLPTWKIFMIQFLNIAGLGPIFGAIMGAKFGTASYLWIVLEKWDVDGEYEFKMDKPFLNVSVIDGKGEADGIKVKKGDHFIVPATMDSCGFSGKMTVMVSYC